MKVNDLILSVLESSKENLIFEKKDNDYFCAICKKTDVIDLIKFCVKYLPEKERELFEKTLESLDLATMVLKSSE